MGLFGKKDKLVLNEYQKDKLLEKLEDANIKYSLSIDHNFDYLKEPMYKIVVNSEDLKKVV